MDGSWMDGGRRGRHRREDIRIDEIMRGKKTTAGQGKPGVPITLAQNKPTTLLSELRCLPTFKLK
jgi:hypothetical protein